MSVSQSRDLQDEKALVTGATSGIGRAIALQLARDGAEVIIHGRHAERGAATVEQIIAAGGRARFIAADLGKPAEVRRLAEGVAEVAVRLSDPGLATSVRTEDVTGRCSPDSGPPWPPRPPGHRGRSPKCSHSSPRRARVTYPAPWSRRTAAAPRSSPSIKGQSHENRPPQRRSLG